MIREIAAALNFSIDDYISINEFKDINVHIENNDPFFIASIVGWMEGIYKINKEKNCLIFLDMYKINLNTNYKFYGLYSFIKSHNEYYKYIINYFNTWHKQDHEYFYYDEYSKKDLINNFYELATFLINEKELAENNNDKELINIYNLFCKNLTSILNNR